MSLGTNCWVFEPEANSKRMIMNSGFIVGTATIDGEAKKCVRIGDNVPPRGRLFVQNGTLIKTMGGSIPRVYTADVVKHTNANLHDLVACSPDCTATLIIVKSERDVESHEGHSKPHFDEDHTVWIGADGGKRITQVESNKSPVKKQLFRLEPDETLLFFDAKREVTLITAEGRGKKPTCRRATREEVADYIVEQARTRGHHSRTTRAWCYRTLQKLQCAKQINAFAELYPTFRPS